MPFVDPKKMTSEPSSLVEVHAQVAQVRAQAGAAAAQVTQSEAQLLRARQDAERFGQLYNTQMKAVSKAELDAATAARSAPVPVVTVPVVQSGPSFSRYLLPAGAVLGTILLVRHLRKRSR